MNMSSWLAIGSRSPAALQGRDVSLAIFFAAVILSDLVLVKRLLKNKSIVLVLVSQLNRKKGY